MSSLKSRFEQYILPGIIFQSVLIGGAYATGREIVEYGAKFGSLGIWSVAAIFAGFVIFASLTYEFARLNRAYDYRTFVKSLIGPLWPIFDAVFLVMVIVIIAVVSAASGVVVEEILGWPYWAGVMLVIALVGVFELPWPAHYRTIQDRGDGAPICRVPYLQWCRPRVDLGAGGGSVRDARPLVYRRSDARLGSVFRGALRRILLGSDAELSLCARSPDRATPSARCRAGKRHSSDRAVCAHVFRSDGLLSRRGCAGASVPWLAMLKQVAGTGVITLYALVVLWTLIETSTGLIHAVTDRVSVSLEESGRGALTPTQVVALTVGLLLSAAVLSRIGIIALVAKGYGAMAYAFLLLFALPLLTVGVARILRYSR